MAARYVEITFEEMEKYLKRAFRMMRPKQAIIRGTYVYDLKLSNSVGIRVWTSIPTRRGTGKPVGESAIRVGLCILGGRSLKKGKMPIVKRTQNWRTNLQNRIEDEIEDYDNREDYWESKAGNEPDRITDSQMGTVRDLASKLKGLGWKDRDFDRLAKDSGVPEDPSEFTKVQAGQFIEALEVKAAAVEKAQARTPEPKFSGGAATFSKLRSGEWGIRGMDLVEGEMVTVTRRNGSNATLTVGRVVWQDADGTSLAEIERSSRRYAAELMGEGPPV